MALPPAQVWKGVIQEGSPLVWSNCRHDINHHQQWSYERTATASGQSPTFLLRQGAPGAAATEPLCVASPVPTTLLMDTGEGR